MYKSKLILVGLLTGLLLPLVAVQAQKRASKQLIRVTASIVDMEGNPVTSAAVFAQEGKATTLSNQQGQFTIESEADGNILIEATSYENRIVKASDAANQKIRMLQAGFHLGEKDKVQVSFGELTKRRVTGAVTEINVKDLEDRYSAWNYSLLLKSEGFGLLGSGNIRGTGSTIVIDGLVRDGSSSVSALSDLMNSTEIESITLLKDVTSRLLYGSLSDAGVLMIKTRRGEALKRQINIKYEGSAGYSLGYPQFLDAAEYMFLYNEALRNDGLAPKYTDEEIQKTKDGVDLIRYPNQQYYNNTFLSKVKPQHRLNAEFSGGNQTARY